MTIDRTRFLKLALGMSLGAAACGGGQKPAAGSGGGDEAMKMAPPTAEGGVPNDPSCVGYDPTNECVAWADGNRAPGFAMTSECVRWDPTNECTAWAYNPTHE